MQKICIQNSFLRALLLENYSLKLLNLIPAIDSDLKVHQVPSGLFLNYFVPIKCGLHVITCDTMLYNIAICYYT